MRCDESTQNEALASNGLKFRVVSYNVLADDLAKEHYRDLYSPTPKKFVLDWSSRLERIMREIGKIAPDLVCLQEVEAKHWSAWRARMAKFGFKGSFAGRTGGCIGGCASFWKDDIFKLAESPDLIKFSRISRVDLKHNVCVIVRLQLRAAKDARNRELVVGNCHLLFNPKRGDIKLGQLRVIFEKIGRLRRSGGEDPHDLIICGDFNSAPDSPVYRFVSEGELDCVAHDRRHLSGQVEGIDRGFANFNPSLNRFHVPPDEDEEIEEAVEGLESVAVKMGENHWSPKQLMNARGSSDLDATRMRHDLNLTSAYACLCGGREPKFTSAHNRFVGTVDYVWYGGRLEPLAVLDVPCKGVPRKAMPNKQWPSDHVALCADFVCV